MHKISIQIFFFLNDDEIVIAMFIQQKIEDEIVIAMFKEEN